MIYDPVDTTPDKLIILYLLSKIPTPLTLSQITTAILEQDYCDYFSLQQNLAQLKNSSLIVKSTRENLSSYAITPAGAELAKTHLDKIKKDIVAEINQFISDNYMSAKNILDVSASYIKEKEHEYIVNCKIVEKTSTLIELNLNVSTNNMANSICNNFKNNTNEIYSEILHLLMRG
ncbi:DUF4364 family protein [Candidatus Epulonipiscium viviparus]|uniref:DUF4364 family protein n=3 Tax=Candidatus Epulonipiscium viviparus TaxID=420336 RepID=UPI0027380B4A|nr:DUF4364 family protein [Candidatus Epulopiscium viviparus]